MTALFLVVAVGFLGPIVARVAAGLLGPPLARLSPVGGFLASSNLRTATRRFSSASTPLVLTVAMSCTLLFSSTTTDHAVTQQRQAGLAGELRHHEHRSGIAGRDAGRRARHSRSALGGRADPHDTRPEPGGLR